VMPIVLQRTMRAVVPRIDPKSSQPEHRLRKFRDGRITLTLHQQQTIATRTQHDRGCIGALRISRTSFGGC
jgi:hypothetical protein